MYVERPDASKDPVFYLAEYLFCALKSHWSLKPARTGFQGSSPGVSFPRASQYVAGEQMAQKIKNQSKIRIILSVVPLSIFHHLIHNEIYLPFLMNTFDPPPR